MEKSILVVLFSLVLTAQAFAGHGVERGLVKINDGGKLEQIISKFLSKELTNCSLGLENELFTVKSVEVRKHRVDQGIIDIYYDVNLNYTSPVATNEITVQVLDSDFNNWRDYEEKLSSEISFDKNGHCKK